MRGIYFSFKSNMKNLFKYTLFPPFYRVENKGRWKLKVAQLVRQRPRFPTEMWPAPELISWPDTTLCYTPVVTALNTEHQEALKKLTSSIYSYLYLFYIIFILYI